MGQDCAPRSREHPSAKGDVVSAERGRKYSAVNDSAFPLVAANPRIIATSARALREQLGASGISDARH